MKGAPVLFAGPTLRGVDPKCTEGVMLRPPVRRGSIDAFLDEVTPPGVMIVADGTFHQYPSVGHAEIRRALAASWEVWGVSSMGAIRASEMGHLGMRGFGRVYLHFADDPDFRDDEVALLHGDRPPFIAVTEPLIHIRYLLDDLERRGLISATQSLRISENLAALWYGYRTLALVRTQLSNEASLPPTLVDAELRRIGEFRIKTRDLLDLLSSRPWAK